MFWNLKRMNFEFGSVKVNLGAGLAPWVKCALGTCDSNFLIVLHTHSVKRFFMVVRLAY